MHENKKGFNYIISKNKWVNVLCFVKNGNCFFDTKEDKRGIINKCGFLHITSVDVENNSIKAIYRFPHLDAYGTLLPDRAPIELPLDCDCLVIESEYKDIPGLFGWLVWLA
jgi:hypothetical protein